MDSFEKLTQSKPILSVIHELGFDQPTPMQAQAYSPILAGKDMVGIAQTGTGKTLAYLLPILASLKYSKQSNPRVLVLVPTRELVLQVVEMTKTFAKNLNIRVLGVYGGTNISTQKIAVSQGTDILVATPGRLFDLAVSGVLQLKGIKKLVIDEVDVMLDLGFLPQLTNILEMLPEFRQNLMFSATMTEEVDALIDVFFKAPVKISIAVSGTPLENIAQECYPVPNFFTKVNLLTHLIRNKTQFTKILVFVSNKKIADRLYETLEEGYGSETGIIHSNKSQNYRIRSIRKFEEGKHRILITTDIMARGLDLNKISHVINFDTPSYPENYMHRIGRTGRADQPGNAILFYAEKDEAHKAAIEALMDYKIPVSDFPGEVEISKELLHEEQSKIIVVNKYSKKILPSDRGPAFHEKKEKNKKTNQGGSYLRKMKVYKRPKTRGDKIANQRKKNK